MPSNHAGITGQWKDATGIPGDDLERIRLAILDQALGDEDYRGKVSVARTRELARIDGRKATKVVGDWKRGDSPDLRVSWSGPNQAAQSAPAPVTKKAPSGESGGAPLDPLVSLVEGAGTHDERDNALRAIGAALLRDELTDGRAQQLRAILGEMRLQDKDRRTVPQEDPDRVYLLSADGARIVSAFERIVSNDRRAKALAAVADLLEEDARLLPAVDPVGSL